jgi:hypothetical protein
MRQADSVDPIAGEVIDPTDADALIDFYESMKSLDSQIYVAKQLAAKALAALTTGETKSRRLQGQRRKVKIEMPSTTWENSKLKEAWNSFPHLRETYLRIGTIEPQLVEIKKLRNTSGPPDLETFKSMVFAAEREPTGTPKVTIEE